jgi:hypothetical protein
MVRPVQTIARKRAKYGDAPTRRVSSKNITASSSSSFRGTHTLDILAMAATSTSTKTTTATAAAEAVPVVTPTHTSSAFCEMEHPFALLEQDVVCHILGFCVMPSLPPQAQEAVPSSYYASSCTQQYEQENEQNNAGRQRLLYSCWVLSSVCKQWNMAVGCLMNAKAPFLIVSPAHLHLLKCRALALNLVNVGQDFMERVREMWGDEIIHAYGKHDVSCLDVVIRHFGGTEQDFIELVASEYVQFLIVQCVERMAHNNAWIKEPRLVSRWKDEPCTPPMLVGEFWKAHLLHPRQYARDCNTLLENFLYCPNNSIDNILDRSPATTTTTTTSSRSSSLFTSTRMIRGSDDYTSKKQVLFRTESQFPRVNNMYMGRFGSMEEQQHYSAEYLFSEWFHPKDVATRLVDALY